MRHPDHRHRNHQSIQDRYQMGNQIGQGSFGVVYVATDKKSGALVRFVVRMRRSINVCTLHRFATPPLNIFRLTPHVQHIL